MMVAVAVVVAVAVAAVGSRGIPHFALIARFEQQLRLYKCIDMSRDGLLRGAVKEKEKEEQTNKKRKR